MAIPKKILNSKNPKDLEDYKAGKITEDSHPHLYEAPPSFLQMVRNFKKDVKNFVKSGADIMDSAGYTNRLAECNECEYLIRKSMRCGACGCLLEAKARMKSSYCPKGKWENGIQPDGKK